MDKIREKKGYICDMDGVIYHGNRILPGVVEFVNWLYEKDKKFLFLTNNSGKTPRQLHEKLAWMGLQVDESHFYTSAQATADFIARQMPGAHVFVIGEPGLYNALYERGITLTDTNPDYVVVGEATSYNYDNILPCGTPCIPRGTAHCHQSGPHRPHRTGHSSGLSGTGQAH